MAREGCDFSKFWYRDFGRKWDSVAIEDLSATGMKLAPKQSFSKFLQAEIVALVLSKKMTISWSAWHAWVPLPIVKQETLDFALNLGLSRTSVVEKEANIYRDYLW
jgi:hypothetical protein